MDLVEISFRGIGERDENNKVLQIPRSCDNLNAERVAQVEKGSIHDRIRKWRLEAVQPWLRGKVLDVGCGDNEFLATWEDGVGVDVYPWEGLDVIVDSAHLPFNSDSFDTTCCIAALNHIPNREEVLRDMHRVLKPGGRLLVTMINPIVGWVCHHLLPGEESHTRGMAPGELHGMWSGEVVRLVKRLGFELEDTKCFGLLKLNTLYVFRKVAHKTAFFPQQPMSACK